MENNYINSSLFYLPQHRTSLFDRITDAYFKRPKKSTEKLKNESYKDKGRITHKSQILPKSPQSNNLTNY